jgi:hypothetical protein
MSTYNNTRVQRALTSPGVYKHDNMEDMGVAEVDALLEAYYDNNGLYSDVQALAYQQGLWIPGMLPLRNPCHAVVEFYVAKVWPGQLPTALPIITSEANKKIIEPIQKIWKWSNFSIKKSLAARWFSLYGNWFARVQTKEGPDGKPNRVIIRSVKPSYATEFEVDDAGNIYYIRLDFPPKKKDALNGQYLTEVWDKDKQTRTVYDNAQGPSAKISNLTVRETTPFTKMGIDFIPIVHAAFFDSGEARGLNCFQHALDPIDEANRQASRLHQLIFRYNKPTTGIFANSVDASNRPLPAPRILGEAGTQASDGSETTSDEDIRYFPGHSDMKHMVAALDYANHLQTISDQMGQIEQLLPELTYYRLLAMGTPPSGEAAITLLDAAISRVMEARGSMESALERADSIALTLASNAKLKGFENVGNYADGDFDHTFAPRPVMRISGLTAAQTLGEEVKATVPLIVAAQRAGWSQDDLEKLQTAIDDKAKSDAATNAQMLANAERLLRQNQSTAPNLTANPLTSPQPPLNA